MKRTLIIITVCVLTFVGPGVHASAKKDNSAPAPQTPQAAKTAGEDSILSGKVVETMNSGGYTYVRLEKNGKKTWAAIPAAEVKVGQELALQPGIEMNNFTSKTLNRSFESIIFSGGLMTKGKPAAGGGDSKPGGSPHGGVTQAAKVSEKISVDKAAGPDAYTVGEIHEKTAALNEKTVVVRGKVVKVSEGIMGKNWFHLQDGTGDASRGTHKLVVTSQDLPAVGDVVTVKGTIYKDKDFGAGYKYAVIMEKGAIQH
ncbi:MAG TPA: DNA-binding protein [Nitrospirota bacterium]